MGVGGVFAGQHFELVCLTKTHRVIAFGQWVLPSPVGMASEAPVRITSSRTAGLQVTISRLLTQTEPPALFRGRVALELNLE